MNTAHELPARTMLPFEVRLASWLGLVRKLLVVRLAGRPHWGILIVGRGFRRMLDAELVHARSVYRPVAPSARQPRVFFSAAHAHRAASDWSVGVAGQ